MALTRLTLTDFRSYEALELAPQPGFVVLTGDNGAGKTNILEAVSMLAPGRGLRATGLHELARRDGQGAFTVAAALRDGTAIGTGTLPEAPERRLVRINGASAPASALAERVSVLWLTPAQDRLFNDSAGSRRRFLDRMVLALDPAHGRHATRYEAAMRQRNRLLAEGGEPTWLDALELAMAEHGAALASARQLLVDDLAATQRSDAEAPFPIARFELGDDPSARLRERLAASRPRDAAAGRALYGPHTQDLLVRYAAKDQPAAQSSTGEQKALLIGIILAHSELVARRTGRRPILLLDEVGAHLDPGRRTALFERLAGRGQVWMTGTERAAFSSASDAQLLEVASGGVTG